MTESMKNFILNSITMHQITEGRLLYKELTRMTAMTCTKRRFLRAAVRSMYTVEAMNHSREPFIEREPLQPTNF